MSEHPLTAKDLSETWRALRACRDRGIHVHDDATGSTCYRSYAELACEAERLAAYLSQCGVPSNSAVLLSAETSQQFPVLWLALLWLGCTPVPMPPSYSLSGERAFADRVTHVVQYFSVYLCADADFEQVQATIARTGASTRAFRLSEIYRGLELQDAIRALPPQFLSRDDVAFIQFTSGSTRAPKGVRVTYANLYANVAAMAARLAVAPERHAFISWLPLYHDMGLVGKFLMPLLTQTSLILTSPQFFSRRPLQFLSLATKFQPQFCSMPNFAYEWILKRLTAQKSASFSLSSFNWLGVGAEPVNPKAMADFEQCMKPYGLREGVLSPCYGLAEATLAVTIATPGAGFALAKKTHDIFVTCGRALDDMQIRVVGSEVGRIKISGPSVASTAMLDGELVSLLDEDGFYDTKDIGYFLDDKLVVLGRADEMFIINGVNYFPYDIEGVVRDVPGVLKRRAMCFYVPPSPTVQRGEIVVLYETHALSSDEEDAMRQKIHAAVLSYTGLAVDTIIAVAPRAIPVTSSGKLQRLKARELYTQGFIFFRANEALPA